MKCDYCGEEIDGIPWKCKYCGGTFCVKHHLPENHNCPSLALLKATKASDGKWFYLPYPSRGRTVEDIKEKPIEVPVKSSSHRRSQAKYSSPEISMGKAGKVVLSLILVFVLVAIYVVYNWIAIPPVRITVTEPSTVTPATSQGNTAQQTSTQPTIVASYDSIEDIAKNPEKYVGKVVRIRGLLGLAFVSVSSCTSPEGLTLSNLSLEDSQGYYVLIVPPSEQRNLYRGELYEAVGKVEKFHCEYRSDVYAVVVYEIRKL
ncbi:AN1-type zinc finger protein [Infirmifilum sp. NZ]|uniref:AN1-type zinc finger protein n=1 Tax=Infirmifilum sp. NZ TaxID=2926850 RepID=UPI0027A3BD85|nr:zinc finger AN1 domain-containing stress-associated protein [Infirmifilum sp. NZ]UNQ73586.1 zinc finger AN1 domain-containing stress-associated protein [Infirmifilum sp. NZ]